MMPLDYNANKNKRTNKIQKSVNELVSEWVNDSECEVKLKETGKQKWKKLKNVEKTLPYECITAAVYKSKQTNIKINPQLHTYVFVLESICMCRGMCVCVCMFVNY